MTASTWERFADLLDPPAPPEATEMMIAAGMPADPWQSEVLTSTSDRILLLCCRQAGKSTVTAALALNVATVEPGSLILLLSPSQRQSGELFRKVSHFLRSQPHPPVISSQTALTITFANGSRIVALPGSEETVRGFSGVRLLVIDEAARVDDSLYRSLRPMLAVSGGHLVAMTTPWGKRGWFHSEWTAGGDTWHRVKVTADDCPRISSDFLAEERVSLGDWWFRQEYDVEFVDTSSQMFTFEEVTGALSADVTPLFPTTNQQTGDSS